ncbi:hypothetical protein C8J56DRAFT_896519 [Mycena floridula]|nr:hypothetical protein C8J56DRAFT_896519 [Mycena floridula]
MALDGDFHIDAIRSSLTKNMTAKLPEIRDKIVTATAEIIPARDGASLWHRSCSTLIVSSRSSYPVMLASTPTTAMVALSGPDFMIPTAGDFEDTAKRMLQTRDGEILLDILSPDAFPSLLLGKIVTMKDR